jgi:DNA-directed RNA polymerase II subunit RPB1
MDFRFKPSSAPIKKVVAIQFGVTSPQYIKDTSVTQSIYDTSGKKLPAGIFDQNKIYDPVTKKAILGGINDPRMGTTFDGECPGYFGHIELVKPVYHYGFLNNILDILRSVSYYTSKLIISPQDLEIIKKTCKKKKRLKEILKKTKSKICRDTKRALPLYSKDSLKIVVEHLDPEMIASHGEGKRTLSTLEAYSILEKISDEDAISLGFNPKFCRPEWLMISVMPVAPPHVRPAVSMSSTQRCEDDLTHKLNDILKANISLKNAIEKNDEPHMIELLENYLQYHVAVFYFHHKYKIVVDY